MTEALDAAQRTSLEKLVLRCRHLLETDLAQELERRYGIQKSGVIEAETSLTLDASALESRRDLESVVVHLRSEGESARGSVERLVREAAFTHLNRLVAVRIAEAIGMLPQTLSGGIEAAGFRDFREMAPLAGSDDWDRFRLFLGLCADELAADVPALFDPRNPVLVLQPSIPTLVDLVGTISTAPAAVWDAPDTLGWVYQFFNTGDERRAMREARAPRDSRELAVRNQFFTPRYVVDFLVQNGLGAHLARGIPDLVDDLPYLVEPPTERIAIDLGDISVLDPACGSGHFLLGAYDVLERAWHHAGVPPEESAPVIISSLWGVDIDPRCTQIAQAAIVFRARRHHRSGELPLVNIICARALPAGPEADALVASLPDGIGAAVRTISAELETAPVLGPLLKIEERLEHEIRASVFSGQVVEGTLAESLEGDAFTAVESQVLDALTAISNAATSTAAERLFAAEATDAVRFVEAMRRRYTTVLMNPPFGEPVPMTKTYLKGAYPWTPTTGDLFALFVGRGLQLCQESGYLGAITSRVGMFLTSFETWREEVLLAHELVVLADLGEGVMEQAMVEAAAYVLSNRPRSDRPPLFIRALTDAARASAITMAVNAVRAGIDDPQVFRPDLNRLRDLDGAPLAYWIDSETVSVFVTHPAFEPGHGVVRQGLATGDDFQFVRAWWEVDPRRSTRSYAEAGGRDERTQLSTGARWVPIIKGGASQPWFSPVLLVVDWEGDGERLKSFVDAAGKLRSRPQNTDLYFKPGFSWTRRAPRLVPYVVPSGCVPSVSRYQAFPAVDPYAAVGLVASNIATAFCRFYGEKFLWPNFLVDNVKNLPMPPVDEQLLEALALAVREHVDERRGTYTHLEPYREFTAPREDIGSLRWDPRSLLGDALETRVAEAYGLTPGQADHLDLDMREALSALGMDAAQVETRDDEMGELPSWGERLVSYLLGVAFGRWDIRIGRDPAVAPPMPNPFDPPGLPPGMLVGEDGWPFRGDAPDDYPIPLPPARVLLDEPGHEWDIASRVSNAAGFLCSDPDGEITRALKMLKRETVRDYLRRQFFKDHLGVYTKGRRAAPIYWQLSVPSRSWGVWVYAPALSRETLFAIVREADRRERLAADQIRQLGAEREDGGAGRSVSEVAKALVAEEKLAEELRVFRRDAERTAGLGWVPDLDDGIVLNAAPLADLFPAWKKAAAYRDDLRAGKHEWATVARWSDRL